MKGCRQSTGVAIAAVLWFGTSICRADPMLNLTSPDDLSNLEIGNTVTIEVHLTGLESGITLDTLGADVLLDELGFDVLAGPTAGPIIPDPTSNFFTLADPDLVSGAFFMVNGDEGISSDGLLFSFTLTVTANRSGSLFLDADAAFAEQPGGLVIPVATGTAIPFNVPEPSILTAAFVLMTRVGRQHRLFASRKTARTECKHLRR